VAAVATAFGVTVSGGTAELYHVVHNHFYPQSPGQTVFHTFDPWQAPGASAAADRALRAALTATCDDPSRAKYASNTHRCSLTNDHIEDPCFDPPIGGAETGSQVVACVGTPWEQPIFVKLSGKASTIEGATAEDGKRDVSTLWAFQLNNGDRCVHYPEGTAEYIGQQIILYLCARGSVTDVDGQQQPWRAEYFGNGSTQSEDVPLTVAWF
jgi:hypothetical protein